MNITIRLVFKASLLYRVTLFEIECLEWLQKRQYNHKQKSKQIMNSKKEETYYRHLNKCSEYKTLFHD